MVTRRLVNFLRWVYKVVIHVVLVKNASWKLRMCIDYINIIRACPKDSYLLLNIYKLVDNLVGHRLLSFVGSYSGYNQIPMYETGWIKTTFIT